MKVGEGGGVGAVCVPMSHHMAVREREGGVKQNRIKNHELIAQKQPGKSSASSCWQMRTCFAF